MISSKPDRGWPDSNEVSRRNSLKMAELWRLFTMLDHLWILTILGLEMQGFPFRIVLRRRAHFIGRGEEPALPGVG